MADELSIVVLTYNTKELTLRCLKSIFDKDWRVKFDVWVVDNASSDGTLEAVREEFPKVKALQNGENGGFSKGNNQALRKIGSDYVMLLNSDTEVLEGSLDNILDFAKKGDYGITSCELRNRDGSFQPNTGHFPTFLPMFLWLSGLDDILRKFFPVSSYQERDSGYYKEGEKDWVGGTAMLIRQDVFKKIGYLDEAIFMYGEDVDFCWRARKSGFKIGWTDSAKIQHLSGGSSKSPKVAQWTGEFKGLLYLYKKYYGEGASLFLRALIYIFSILRVLAFGVTGKLEYSVGYVKVITSL